jgi:hypothetical protein
MPSVDQFKIGWIGSEKCIWDMIENDVTVFLFVPEISIFLRFC